MVLQRRNFSVPAQFTFRPFSAKWRIVDAETLDWSHAPKLRMMAEYTNASEKTWLRVEVQVPPDGVSAMLNFEPTRSFTILMDPAHIPSQVLSANENCHNTPDISGRKFQVLISTEPEVKGLFWNLKPGDASKNAWIMRDEFLNLKATQDSEWEWTVSLFLNKWGVWESGTGYWQDWKSTSLLPPSFSAPGSKREEPDFLLTSPYWIKVEQEKFRRAILPSNARDWLRSHSLSLEPADDSSLFRVQRSHCKDAIEATITIDHLAEAKFAICKRCHKVFEKEKKYKMSYCSRPCANAASVERFRERQRKAGRKGGKGNAKS